MYPYIIVIIILIIGNAIVAQDGTGWLAAIYSNTIIQMRAGEKREEPSTQGRGLEICWSWGRMLFYDAGVIWYEDPTPALGVPPLPRCDGGGVGEGARYPTKS
jgi:hypothetical protein